MRLGAARFGLIDIKEPTRPFKYPYAQGRFGFSGFLEASETMTSTLGALIERAKGHPPTPTAVAHPCDAASIAGAVDAALAGLIAPILIGPPGKIARAAAAAASISPPTRWSRPRTATNPRRRRSRSCAKAGRRR